MTKAIIFDCWNTLFHNTQKPHPFKLFAQKLGCDIKDYKFIKLFEKHFMLKINNNIRVPIINLLIELNIKPTKQKVSTLEKIYKKSYSYHAPFPEVLKELRFLKKKYKLGLITNTDYENFNKLCAKYKIEKFFDVIIPSFSVGIMKPNPKIFELMVNKLGINKKDIVMVGDSLEDDIRGAENIGIRGILIDRKNKHPKYKKRITSLKELKKFL
ncbi:MAG: HAD family hydrolase [Candidatus Woesearchaeota archaeon]